MYHTQTTGRNTGDYVTIGCDDYHNVRDVINMLNSMQWPYLSGQWGSKITRLINTILFGRHAMTSTTSKKEKRPKNKLLRLIIWGVIGIAAVLLIIFVGLPANQARKQAQTMASYELAAVTRGDLTATVGATGSVRARQSALLTWGTSGSVEVVNGKVGDLVQAGDVLASLAQASLSQNLILAQADLVTAQRNLASLQTSNTQRTQAQVALVNAEKSLASANATLTSLQGSNRGGTTADIENAQAKLTLAQQSVDQAQSLYDLYKDLPDTDSRKAQAYTALYNAQQGLAAAQNNVNYFTLAPSGSDLDLARAKVALAQAQLEDAKREWIRLKDGPDPSDVAAAQARVDATQATINMSRIAAPFTGTITEADPMPGDQVTPGVTAFRLDDLSHLLIDVQVSEVDINTVQVGQPVLVTFDAVLGSEYHGTVTAVASVGTSVQGVVDFTVTVELDDADAAVKPGMTAAVTISVKQLTGVLLVPNRAVRLVNNERVVYLIRNGQVVQIPITLGASADTLSEVFSGDVSEGDQVILNPPANFTSGNGGGGGPFGGG